jgi:hypothetical protein
MATSKLKPSVTAYKNNLANALHGLDTVRALDLSACDPDDYEKVLLAHQAKQKSHIDGCSGSRKKGIVFTSTAPIGEGVVERYFSGSKRVTHGSILFSECRKMFHLESLCYQVQTDDSPGLGDCHGMIAQSLYTQLQDFYPLGNDTCIQFRFGVKDKWLAKGTVLPYPDSYLPDGVALVLPDSCFKGKCPDLHTTQCDDVIFGILHTSKVGRYKTSHQVLQCFVNPDSQQYLVDKAVESMTALIASRNTTTSFAQHMLECMAKDPTDTIDCFPASLNDGFDDNDQQEDPMPLLTVVAADQYYQLHSHPTVVSKLNDLFRRRVVEIATGKHLTATGLMANPLVNLKPGYVISNSLPTGEYLMFRYPVRHYGDIKVIKLVNPNDPLDIDGHVVDPKRKLIAALNGGLSKLSDHQTYFATPGVAPLPSNLTTPLK